MDKLFARIGLLEERVRVLSEVASRQAGELIAVSTALQGILRVAGTNPDVRASVDRQLEKGHASTLAESHNQILVDAFQETQALLTLAMDDHKERQALDSAPSDAPDRA